MNPLPTYSLERDTASFAGRRAILVEAAALHSSRYGMDHLSVAAVARTVGINRTTAHYYFPNRGRLVGAVKDWAFEQIVTRIVDGETLSATLGRISRFTLEHPAVTKILIAELSLDENSRGNGWSRTVATLRDVLTVSTGNMAEAENMAAAILASLIAGPVILKQTVGDNEPDGQIADRFNDLYERAFLPAIQDVAVVPC